MRRLHLSKEERRSIVPARKKGVFLYELAPIGCPDASAGEVSKALFALAWEAGVAVGRGSGYDQLRDEYTVIGKHKASGKAQDFKIAGAEVAAAIKIARMLNGGAMHRPAAWAR